MDRTIWASARCSSAISPLAIAWFSKTGPPPPLAVAVGGTVHRVGRRVLAERPKPTHHLELDSPASDCGLISAARSPCKVYRCSAGDHDQPSACSWVMASITRSFWTPSDVDSRLPGLRLRRNYVHGHTHAFGRPDVERDQSIGVPGGIPFALSLTWARSRRRAPDVIAAGLQEVREDLRAYRGWFSLPYP